MIYFCADDYGVSKESNRRIESCLGSSVLNKISVLPNGVFENIKEHLPDNLAKVSLHLNLIEGYPLSDPREIPLLVSKEGCFKYSFVGLFFRSFSMKRKEFEKQIYKEIKSQIIFWKKQVGEKASILIDSHQHTHMIPLIFKTLMSVIKDEDLDVEYIRISSEPITPYILAPSLYFSYNPVGIIKQWLLNMLAFVNRKELRVSKIKFGYFMGVMFSGKLTEVKIRRILPRYLKIAEREGRDVEIAFHPGYLNRGEKLVDGNRRNFERFYFSPWRKKEFDELKTISTEQKEG